MEPSYYEANREKVQAKQREYREANKAKIAAKKREYREANKEKIAAKKREYRQANQEMVARKKREYYQANKERIAERDAQCYREHRDEMLERMQRYRQANPEKIREGKRKYYHSNRERCIASVGAREVRKLDLFVEKVYKSVVFKQHQGICHLCLEAVDPDNWHLEHIIPLIKHGPHCYDNTAPAHPLCNLSKQEKIMSGIPELLSRALEAYGQFHAL